jgi:hypothetical protein
MKASNGPKIRNVSTRTSAAKFSDDSEMGKLWAPKNLIQKHALLKKGKMCPCFTVRRGYWF